MYLKRLEISGFKSFADKTVLNFQPGITAVVGPNGCGKSNIFDSIRWVLGEQSVKAMRGSSMEDVIFNGTDKRIGVGFAEVSLTFSNESKMLPIDYDEVTISRRLFRSGDSEYLINKTQVRLKDVLELFMGTGIGAESYSLIEQGKIDLILSSKPEDRRLIFDEAAGITKYKSKKREALNKLKDTENNLLRINDIIVEVKRQIGSIERQAAKARRYKERFEELKQMELKLAKHQTSTLTRKKEDLSKTINSFNEKETECNTKIEEAESKINECNLKLQELQNNINQEKTQDLKLDSTIEKNTHHIRFNKEHINEISLQKERFKEQENQLNNRVCHQKKKIEEFKKQQESLESTDKEKTDLLVQESASLEEIAKAIKKSQDIIAKSKVKVLDVNSNQSKVKNDIIDINTQAQTLLARKRRLELEKSKIGSEHDNIKSNLDDLTKRIESINLELGQLNSQRNMRSSEIDGLNNQLNDLKKKIEELKNQKLSLESQKEFIEELKLKYEDMPGQTKAVFLTDQKPSDNSTGIIGKVSTVEQSDRKGRIFFKNSFKDANLENIYRLTCEAKFISLDSAQITKRIEELSCEIIESEQQEGSVKSQIEIKKEELFQIEHDLHQKEIVLSNEETQKKGILDELAKLDDELTLVAVELSEANTKLKDFKERQDSLNQESTVLEKENQELNELVASNQKAISLKIDERQETTVSIAQLQTELDSLKDKRNAQSDTLEMLSSALKEDYAELSLIEEEKKKSVERLEKLESELVSLQADIQKIKVQKESLSKELKELYSRDENLASLVKKEQEQLSISKDQLDKIKKDIYDSQMLMQETNYKEQSIKDRIQQTYKLNLDDFQIDAEQVIEEVALNEEITKVKEKLDSFGTVNLVAIEESEELKNRYDFLVNQQNDLLSAKDVLAKTITKINRTTRVMFLEAFEKIAVEFHTYFRSLFGGGDARLMLVDPENVLESGVEIIARPPGKKLQSINLLSGGEKALTAIALIFGVFKVKPSPFCVLDEIDAALDESNIGRFAYMLKDFTKKSQFIVITHNKRTIVNADVMYGITMQETGVSKIVSVKLAEKERELATAAA